MKLRQLHETYFPAGGAKLRGGANRKKFGKGQFWFFSIATP
jgi:hypothetical protein